ncbi:hypothetical protein [Streptomyces sp. Ru72]|uniref:hypothetical protein n=1 Tax=Streptomyces sp. Ru72 TaxID=2080747 RepID=UPI000CDD36C7|nr:hypothetical protein [Streptomyces sp. Ru72]POX47184.1 hypothetical protein C3488_24160 [Streptomyces sp. Ru72]
MTEDFEAILKDGSEELARGTSPRPAAAVRARGDALRRRHRATTAALTVALVAAVGGGAFAVAGTSRQASPPEAVVSPATQNAPTSPPATAPKTPSATPDPATAPVRPPSSSCRSLVVPDQVKDAVTAAYRRSQPGLVHIAPVKGRFYYGACGNVFYAGASFTPTAGAAENEMVQLQDDGAAEKYFTKAPDGDWTYASSDGFPRSPRGCAAVSEIPAALAALWGDCLSRP